MRADIALGLFTTAMAVLGGIVSAHAPQQSKHKWLYGGGFFLLGAFALLFVIRLSNETAVANTKLSDAVTKLQDSTSAVSRQTQEIANAQNRNNELQKALVAQNARMGALSKEIADQITGGESIAYFMAESRPAPPFPLILWVTGKHPMHDLAAEIQETFVPRDLERQRQSMHWIPLGDATKLPAWYPLNEQVGIGRYYFRILAANGMITERLELKMKDGNLIHSMSVFRNGKNLTEIVDDKVTLRYGVR